MLNKSILIGHVATEPQLRFTPGGMAVCSFRVACNRPFAGANGERVCDFLDVVAFRQPAEFAGQHLRKGRLVAVEGSLQVREYTDRDQNRRRATEVVIQVLKALDSPNKTPGTSEVTGEVADTGGDPDAEMLASAQAMLASAGA